MIVRPLGSLAENRLAMETRVGMTCAAPVRPSTEGCKPPVQHGIS